MGENQPLEQRIKAEFEAQVKRSQAAEKDRAKETQDREQRLAKFNQVCEKLKAVWTPRVQEFAKQFGDKIKVVPSLTPTQREAKVSFLTELANVTLTLTVSPSPDITKLVIDYDLLILPMLLEYERHSRLEMPLDAIDANAVGAWIDDRLVSCVRVYLSLRENHLYLKRAMVEDPITKAMFLPEDAKAKLEHAGKTYYFSSDESFRKFKEQHPPAPEAKPAGAAKPAPEPKPAAVGAPAKPEARVTTTPAAGAAKPSKK